MSAQSALTKSRDHQAGGRMKHISEVLSSVLHRQLEQPRLRVLKVDGPTHARCFRNLRAIAEEGEREIHRGWPGRPASERRLRVDPHRPDLVARHTYTLVREGHERHEGESE